MGHEMETGVMIVVYSIIRQMTVIMLIVIIVIIKIIIAIRITIIIIVSSGLAAIEELHMLLQTSWSRRVGTRAKSGCGKEEQR